MATTKEDKSTQTNGLAISASELLQGDFVEFYEVTLPESIPVFGGRLLKLKTLRSSEVDAWEESMASVGDKPADRSNFRARLVQRAIVGDDNRPVFQSHKDGIGKLAALPAGFVNWIFDEVCWRNKIGKDAVKRAEDELAANPTDAP